MDGGSPVWVVLFVVGASLAGLIGFVWYVAEQRRRLPGSGGVGERRGKKMSKKKAIKEARHSRTTTAFVE